MIILVLKFIFCTMLFLKDIRKYGFNIFFLSVLANVNTPMAFAELLEDSISGLGTEDDQIMRLIVWRSEVRF